MIIFPVSSYGPGHNSDINMLYMAERQWFVANHQHSIASSGRLRAHVWLDIDWIYIQILFTRLLIDTQRISCMINGDFAKLFCVGGRDLVPNTPHPPLNN